MPNQPTKERITETLWTHRSDTNEIVGSISKIVFGIAITHWNIIHKGGVSFFELDFVTGPTAAYINIFFAVVSAVIGGCAFLAWQYNNVRLRRSMAMVGIMAWLFFASIILHDDRIINMYFCLLLAFGDMLIYLRLRILNGPRN